MRNLKNQEGPVGAVLNFLQSLKSSQLDTEAFREILAILRETHHVLRDALKSAEDMTIPALKNMTAGEPLRPFLLEKRLIEGLSKYDQSFNTRWIAKLLDQMNEVQKKVDRLHFKSLGGILALQERIATECQQRWSQLPTVTGVEPKPA